MKALETQEFPGGLGGSHLRARVVECETLAPGAVRVSDEAKPCEWQPVELVKPAAYEAAESAPA